MNYFLNFIKKNLFTICCTLLIILLLILKNIQDLNTIYTDIIFAPSNIIDILTIIYTHRVYSIILKPYKKLIFYLLIAFYGFFLCDTSFYIIFSLLKLNSSSNINNSIYYIPYFMGVVFLLLFWVNFVINFINFKKLLLSFILFLFLDIVLLIVFVIDSQWKIKLLSYLGLYNIITALIEIFIFNLAIIVLINSKNKILDLITLGTMFIITSNIWIKYLFLNSNIINFDYTEFINIIGIAFNLRAMMLLYKSSNRKLNSWTNKTSSIKTQVTLFVYIVCIFSFFCLFFLADKLAIVNTNSLASLPLIIMLYSIAMVIASNIMGKKFEAPFRQLEQNTNILLRFPKNHVNTIYTTDEFNRLQEFIIKQIETQNILNYNVIKAVHDFKSPLMLMGEIINLLEDKIPKQQFNRLVLSVKNIRQITSDLLDQHRKQTQDINPNMELSYCLLPNLINEVIQQKVIEWKDNPCQINFTVFTEDIIWINTIDIEFKNIISNLLNNAYEAMSTQKGDIEMNLNSKNTKAYHLTIKDLGCGIPKNELQNVLNGKSLKEKGNGIGLSSAIKFITASKGLLTVESQENIGTTINITLPKISLPKILTNIINIQNNSEIIVFDDDPTIHTKWQKKFTGSNIRPICFLNLDNFTPWIDQQQDISNKILLIDYELGDQVENGLSILKKYNIQHGYIITSYAEQAWCQSLVSDTRYSLIPKSIIDQIIINFIDNNNV